MVFLDYDGTLTSIVERPALATLNADVHATLQRLTDVAEVAIVSGRDLEDVLARVDLQGITVAGSHGFEAHFPDGGRETFAGAESFLAVIDEATGILARKIGGIAGARIERKRFVTAVHYREVDPDRHADVITTASEVVAVHPMLRLGHGKMVVELRPNVDWHKGSFVRAFLDRRPVGRASSVVYVGDDLTDEDAFEALGDLTPVGISIVVGASGGRPTAARFALRDVADVHAWLATLAGELGG